MIGTPDFDAAWSGGPAKLEAQATKSGNQRLDRQWSHIEYSMKENIITSVQRTLEGAGVGTQEEGQVY